MRFAMDGEIGATSSAPWRARMGQNISASVAHKTTQSKSDKSPKSELCCCTMLSTKTEQSDAINARSQNLTPVMCTFCFFMFYLFAISKIE